MAATKRVSKIDELCLNASHIAIAITNKETENRSLSQPELSKCTKVKEDDTHLHYLEEDPKAVTEQNETLMPKTETMKYKEVNNGDSNVSLRNSKTVSQDTDIPLENTQENIVNLKKIPSVKSHENIQDNIEQKKVPSVKNKVPKYKEINVEDISFVKSRENLLGAGGFGDVYKGTYKGLGDAKVALKLLKNSCMSECGLPPEEEKNFKDEAAKMWAAQSPHVVCVHGIVACSKTLTYGIVMEYMHYGSLSKLMTYYDIDVPWSLRIDMLFDVAEGLRWIHERGIVHCDIKVENVLVNRDLKAKISDFGVSKVYRAVTSYLSSCSPTEKKFGGTWIYMAPERIKNMKTLPSEKTDVFSYGVAAYMVLTGCKQKFYEDDISMGILQIGDWECPVGLEDIKKNIQYPNDRYVEDIIKVVLEKMLVKDPEQRRTFQEILTYFNVSVENEVERRRDGDRGRMYAQLDQAKRKLPEYHNQTPERAIIQQPVDTARTQNPNGNSNFYSEQPFHQAVGGRNSYPEDHMDLHCSTKNNELARKNCLVSQGVLRFDEEVCSGRSQPPHYDCAPTPEKLITPVSQQQSTANPKHYSRVTSDNELHRIELEKEKISLERDRIQLEMEKLKLQQASPQPFTPHGYILNVNTTTSLPVQANPPYVQTSSYESPLQQMTETVPGNIKRARKDSLDIVRKNLSLKWTEFLREDMDFSAEEKISNIRHDHRKLQDCVNEALSTWICELGQDATFAKLSKTLERIHLKLYAEQVLAVCGNEGVHPNTSLV